MLFILVNNNVEWNLSILVFGSLGDSSKFYLKFLFIMEE